MEFLREVCLEASQTPKIELFAQSVNGPFSKKVPSGL